MTQTQKDNDCEMRRQCKCIKLHFYHKTPQKIANPNIQPHIFLHTQNYKHKPYKPIQWRTQVFNNKDTLEITDKS